MQSHTHIEREREREGKKNAAMVPWICFSGEFLGPGGCS
jgi:hypothetical protein